MSNFKSLSSTVIWFRQFEQQTPKGQRVNELKKVFKKEGLEECDLNTYEELKQHLFDNTVFDNLADEFSNALAMASTFDGNVQMTTICKYLSDTFTFVR